MKLEVSPRADGDLDEIAAYTMENFGRAQAADYVGGLLRTFEILRDNPRIGPIVRPNGLRRYVYRMHLVFYVLGKDVVRIIHVRHGAKRPPSVEDLDEG